MIVVNKVYISETTSTGSASGTFKAEGECSQIIVQPTTSTTQYDFIITDKNSVKVHESTSIIGTMNDLSQFALKGTHSWEIENATNDEEFKILILVRNS